MGNDIRFMEEKLDQASNFANKIWNASKFVSSNLADEQEVRDFDYEAFEKNKAYDPKMFKLEDKWILNKLDKLVVEVSKNIDNYDIGIALDKIYNFIWNEFCDWYIEMVKTRIYSDDEATKIQVSYVLSYVLGQSLKLLHPFMPFITAKIYPHLIVFGTEDLIVAKWPDLKEKFVFDEEENLVEKLKKLIVEIRNVRAKMNVHPSKKSKLILVTDSDFEELEESRSFLEKLGFSEEIVIRKEEKDIPENSVSIVVDNIKVFIPFEDLVDIKEEIQRLENEKTRLIGEVERGEKMLSNPGFVNKAPEKKVNEEKEKLENYKQMLKSVEERLNGLKK